MSDTNGLLNNAQPQPMSDTINQQQQQQKPPPTILQQSAHPTALIFHFLFRSAALTLYITSGMFGFSYIGTFVLIIILLAADFWTVKNVTGRLLVGLRWWNEIREDGTNVWIFESKEDRNNNAIDSRMFWVSMYVTPALWGLFSFLCLISFKLEWMLVTVVAIILSVANVIGYTKCEKDAKARLQSYIAGQAGNSSFVQNAVNSFISNRITGMFSGGGNNAQPPANRV